MKHQTSVAMMKFLSGVACRLGVAEHVYIVGGAVRNFVLDPTGEKFPIKDLDIVVDSIALSGKDSAWFAHEIAKAIPARTSLVTNQYGVAIILIINDWEVESENLKGEVIEIANARRESYSTDPYGPGKGYKPHTVGPAIIEEDLRRREFSFNALLFRLADLEQGPGRAEVLDLLGVGIDHLKKRLLTTPGDPDRTFTDDPTRMCRAVKFVAKYGFVIDPKVAESIRRNAATLMRMPWDAVRKIVVDDILLGPEPRKSLEVLTVLGLTEVLRTWLEAEPGFEAAVGRALANEDPHLLLDLYEKGWKIRTPLSFLDEPARLRLRIVLGAMAPDSGIAFVEALKKPPLDQPALFAKHKLEGKARQNVVTLARQMLLDNPFCQDRLQDEVDRRLAGI